MGKPGTDAIDYRIYDFKLVSRIKQYLSEQLNPKEINKDDLVEELRFRYREYGRRQKSAFRGLVIRTYNAVSALTPEESDQENSELLGMEPEDGDNVFADYDNNDDIENIDDEDDEEEDMEMEIERIPNQNFLNDYRSIKVINMKAENNDNELINISSDEEAPMNPDPLVEDNHIVAKKSPIARKRVTYREAVKHAEIPHGTKRQSEDPSKQIAKKQKITPSTSIPNVSFELFGGFSKILKTVSELVIHIKESEIYETLGVNPPRGFLLHGPPGCGKTLLAQAIAGELGVPLIRVAGPELVGGVSGESESRIRELFEKALVSAPCILFIDEIDAICPPRDTARREMERRIVAQLLSCIDGLGECLSGVKVVVIGATNRPDALDPALRRAGRFDREICLGIPDRTARQEILQVLTASMKLKPGLDLEWLAASTPGFVGADLKALTAEAAIAAVNRGLEVQRRKANSEATADTPSTSGEDMVNGETSTSEDPPVPEPTGEEEAKKPDEDTKKVESSLKLEEERGYLSLLKSTERLLSPEEMENLFIETEDFVKALKSVQPSAKREGFATVPDVTWNDIGSLKDIRSELEMSIMMPVKYPKEFSMLGINAPTGILLCGPPGCGKTLLAKAVANEANINFISVKGPELLNMYVGESERAVRQCFQRARNSQPCVIFFDEIDALCPKRGVSSEGHNTSARVVNQVLTEMDGVEDRAGVFLMAATNRPDMVDPAVLRPGRLDKILYVGLPNASDREDILRALTKNGTKPPMKDVDFGAVSGESLLDGYTGADLAALVKEAAVLALTEYMKHKDDNQLFVTTQMILQAAAKIRPSVSPKERAHYEKLKITYGPSVHSSNEQSSS